MYIPTRTNVHSPDNLATMESAAIFPALVPMTCLGEYLLRLRGQSKATTRLLGTSCALLKSCLEDNFAAHSAYPQALRVAIRQKAYVDWLKLESEWPGLLTESSQIRLPTVTGLWTEFSAAVDSLLRLDPVKLEIQFWESHVEYRGLHVRPVVVLLCDTLVSMSAELRECIMDILNVQPRYNDIYDDFQHQLDARQSPAANRIPDLTRAITAFLHVPNEVGCLVIVFGKLVQAAIDYQDTVGLPGFQLDLNQHLDRVVDEHRSRISEPFSRTVLEVRQALAVCDFRGTQRLLIEDAAALATRPSYTGLSWDMFKMFAESIMQAANAQGPEFSAHIKLALSRARLYHFLDPTAAKDDAWTWVLDWETPEDEPVSDRDSDSDSDDDVEYDVYDLPEVCFGPVGPPLKVEDYALAITDVSDLPDDDCSICRDSLNVHERVQDEIPVKVECGHAFHYGCLTTLINGLRKFSNLCPNCRRPVCDRRPRRLKDGDELNSVQASDAQEQVVVERFLQYRYGDVVMTD
jgi:hypothetical protein